MRTLYKVFMGALAIMSSLTVNAQLLDFNIKSNNQIFVETALRNAFSTLQQSYQLNDTVRHEVFGSEGNDYFNIVKYVCIRTQGGIIVNQDALKPWEKDKDFNAYRNKYKPVVFRSALTHGNNGKSVLVLNDTISAKNTQLIDKSTLLIYKDSTLNEGLVCDTTSGKKQGWLVWVLKDDHANTDSLSFISYKKDILVEMEKGLSALEPPHTQKSIWGGVYVVPKRTAIGQITFQLVGVVSQKDKSWTLVCPFLKQQTAAKKGLTLIKREDKKSESEENIIKPKRKKRK